MELSKIASAVYNDVMAALSGVNANPVMSFEQLEDEVVEKRLFIIKQLYAKNLLKPEDLMIALNCIPVDCADPAKCNCSKGSHKSEIHFEIPQLITDLGSDAISYVGSLDRKVPFKVYFDPNLAQTHQYKRRGSKSPYVYIERTPNENNMYDCWVYNAPYIKQIAVIGVFKDLRQLGEFTCCQDFNFLDFGTISASVKEALTNEKINYYRKLIQQPMPNTQIPR